MSQEARIIIEAFHKGNKLLVCGNGGSLAMSDHFCAEMISHYTRSYPTIPLTNSTIISAIANDYGFFHTFERQIEALGRPGDVLLVFTTSNVAETKDKNHSRNIWEAMAIAGDKGMSIIEAPRFEIKDSGTEYKQERQLIWLHDLAKEINENY